MSVGTKDMMSADVPDSAARGPQRWTASSVAKLIRGKPARPASGCKRAWKGHCPSHDDRKPSLSVSQKANGQILIHCFAGCPPDRVLKALNMSTSDLFPNRTRARHIAFRYGYYDESYHLLFENVRFQPKDFFQRRPDGMGGWIPNLDGVQRALYRLPEVLLAERVVICEGEKDCRTIRKLEKYLAFPYVATTSGGAETWNPEFAHWLQGRDVVVIPDKGSAGAKFRRAVVRSLRDKARSLKVIELPVGKDVTAWVEAGDGQDWEGAVEQLLQFIAEARELRARQSKDYEAAVVSFLRGTQEAKTLTHIRNGVTGKTSEVEKAFRILLARGEIQKSGKGTRESPFHYSLSLSQNSSLAHTDSLRNVLPAGEADVHETRKSPESIPVPCFSNTEFLKIESGKETRTKDA